MACSATVIDDLARLSVCIAKETYRRLVHLELFGGVDVYVEMVLQCFLSVCIFPSICNTKA